VLDCPLQPQANQHAGRLRQLAPTLPKHDFNTGRSAAKEASWWGALAAYGWLTAAACSSGSITSSTISMIT